VSTRTYWLAQPFEDVCNNADNELAQANGWKCDTTKLEGGPGKQYKKGLTEEVVLTSDVGGTVVCIYRDPTISDRLQEWLWRLTRGGT
jgi:hypothetical protein